MSSHRPGDSQVVGGHFHPVDDTVINRGMGGRSHQLINRFYQLVDELSADECRRLQRILNDNHQITPDDRLYPIVQLYSLLPWRINQWVAREYVRLQMLTRARPS